MNNILPFFERKIDRQTDRKTGTEAVRQTGTEADR
jgi:hypothetical protein